MPFLHLPQAAPDQLEPLQALQLEGVSYCCNKERNELRTGRGAIVGDAIVDTARLF